VGTNQEGNLGEHSFAGLGPNIRDVVTAIDFANTTELTVEGNNRARFFGVNLKTSADNFFGVVGTTTGLCTFHAAGNAGIFFDVEEEDLLAFGDSLLEVFGLGDGARESINEIVLKKLEAVIKTVIENKKEKGRVSYYI